MYNLYYIVDISELTHTANIVQTRNQRYLNILYFF